MLTPNASWSIFFSPSDYLALILVASGLFSCSEVLLETTRLFKTPPSSLLNIDLFSANAVCTQYLSWGQQRRMRNILEKKKQHCAETDLICRRQIYGMSKLLQQGYIRIIILRLCTLCFFVCFFFYNQKQKLRVIFFTV